MNKYIDHTLLKADATKEQIEKLCKEAIEYNFFSVCVNSSWVTYCKELLKDSDVKVCAVVGFPLGAMSTKAKALEAKTACEDGADELDMVISIGKLKSNMDNDVFDDIKAVVNASTSPVKVIIETCLLTDEEKKRVTQMVVDAKAAFVKTSTGFSTAGATIADVELMKSVVKDEIEIKAAGGVSNVDDLNAMIKAGATRIGTSRGVSLMEMAKGNKVESSNGY